MSTYNIIAASNESTVVAEYTPESSRSDSFQSEAALEKEFIRMLTAQGYEYLTIHDENRETVFGRQAACMSMCRFSLFPMERTPNIIPTPLETATSRKWASLQNRNLRKQAIALSLLLSGQMVTIR